MAENKNDKAAPKSENKKENQNHNSDHHEIGHLSGAAPHRCRGLQCDQEKDRGAIKEKK